MIFQLGGGPQRFTALKRSVDGISQRMLTVTLRGLERDGIVSRTMYPVMPPRVDYELTKMGQSLLEAVASLMAWADAHLCGDLPAAATAYAEAARRATNVAERDHLVRQAARARGRRAGASRECWRSSRSGACSASAIPLLQARSH